MLRPIFAAVLLTSACGSDPSTCTGTLAGSVVGSFTCSFQASYASGSVVSINTSTGPAGLRDLSLAFTLANKLQTRSYAVADLQSVTGQVVHADFAVFQVLKMPARGTATLALTKVDESQSTQQQSHYGLAGSADATLVDSTGPTPNTVTVHVDF